MVWASGGERLYCRRTDSRDNLAQLLVKVRDRTGLRDVQFPLFSGDGDRVPDVFTGDRLLNDSEIVSAVCANVTQPAPTNKRGEFYIEAGFGRSEAEMVPFMAGYVYAGHAVSLGEFTEPVSGMGRKVNNEAPSTLVNNTVLTRTISVPTNARWLLYGGKAFNADNVARVLTILADDGTNRLFILYTKTLGATTRMTYPHNDSGEIDMLTEYPIPLSEGDRISFTFAAGGASAGGTARTSAVVEEWIET